MAIEPTKHPESNLGIHAKNTRIQPKDMVISPTKLCIFFEEQWEPIAQKNWWFRRPIDPKWSAFGLQVAIIWFLEGVLVSEEEDETNSLNHHFEQLEMCRFK